MEFVSDSSSGLLVPDREIKYSDTEVIRPSPFILFEEDWGYYPTAVIHHDTTNRSFVDQAAKYRAMGIRNHFFHLALINPDLRGVDPHDPNITQEEIGLIALEVLANPWYWFREVLRAPAQAGSAARMFQANRGNLALYWLYFNHVMTILIQPRQTGKSFSTDGLMLYLMNVACRGTQINLMTKDDTLRRRNIERLKEMRLALPEYFQVKQYNDSNNLEEITVKRYNNIYLSHVPQSSVKAALNQGRGLTSENFHIDEPNFQKNIHHSLGAALAAGGAACDIAAAAGTPYGTIMTTTAGKKDTPEGKYIYKLLTEAAFFTEKFFDCKNITHLNETILRNSPGKVIRVNCTFNHRQLGYTDEWLLRKIQASLQEGEAADRDYFNVWTSGTESSPFTVEMTERIARNVLQEPLYEEISKEGYVIRWYIPEESIPGAMAQDHHILALDTSEALGGKNDDISFVLLNTRTLRVAAAGTFNETNLIVFSQFLCNFIIKYKRMTTIIERRSTGGMILDYLLLQLPQLGEDPFQRLFNRVVHEADEWKERFKEILVPLHRRSNDIYVRYKRFFGWSTSGSGYASRSELYGTTMQAALKKAGDRIYDPRIINQMLGLIIKNGRIDHQDGEHDDMVIGWLLTQWLILHGRNLSYYGIDSSLIAIDAYRERGEVVSASEHRQRQEQRVLRERISTLVDDLSNTNDPYVIQRLEAQLKFLENKLILEEGENFSVDSLIQDIRDRKRSKQRDRSNTYSSQRTHGPQSRKPLVPQSPYGRSTSVSTGFGSFR